MKNELRTYISAGFLLFFGIKQVAEATQIDLLFDVQLDRAYSLNGVPFTGSNISDMSTMQISFNSEIASIYESVEPWGVGTSRLFTNLVGPVHVNSPFTQYVPTNPIYNPAANSFSAAGVTSNDRPGYENGRWYEGLWFTNQYRQFSQSDADGIYAYRYGFNIHWNMIHYNYMPGDLYFFEESDVLNILSRSILKGITFSINEVAYIEYSDGSYFGYDLLGTATLKEYFIVSTVSEPASVFLFITCVIGLAGIQLQRGNVKIHKRKK